ncbi:MAG: hypothetical protein H6836_07010 [Planctomycetes bacterium]|nr:hypothetical protein [Planctomycetota bacterium]MCB9872491.1 hypothetical protein [Planctomycetota bacterium]MCB9888644.1 hypothetical protein [Planctomycetota bacterium]MCB9889311.1 hypothetical protein [Planctomycetota bacterium]
MNQTRTCARRPVQPPRPDQIRTPEGRFGWLDDRLLQEGWLSRLGPEGTAVLVLLALAADRQGTSFYGRERMTSVLGMSRSDVDFALSRLKELGLVAHRPWRAGHADGVWQLLPLPRSERGPRPSGEPVSIRSVLESLGLSA